MMEPNHLAFALNAVNNELARFESMPQRRGTLQVYNCLLSQFLNLTSSEYGMIALSERDQQGPFIRIVCASGMVWSDGFKATYEEASVNGFEYRNLDTMFGWPILNRRTCISNDPSNDERMKIGIPAGHPPLNRFLAIPFFYEEEVVGTVQVANSKEAYTPEAVDELRPLSELGASICARSELHKTEGHVMLSRLRLR